jgi:hypothetical protein
LPFKGLPKLLRNWGFGLKTNHLATLLPMLAPLFLTKKERSADDRIPKKIISVDSKASHRNLRTISSMLAQVLQIFLGKEHLVKIGSSPP